MSRGASFVALGRTFRHSGDVRYRDTFVRHIASWPDVNPVGNYPRPCLMLRGAAELPARFDMIFIVQD